MKMLHKIAHILLLIGGLNWLLTGLFTGWDLGDFLGATIVRIIYVLVGLAAIYDIVTIKNCACCNAKDTPKPTPSM